MSWDVARDLLGKGHESTRSLQHDTRKGPREALLRRLSSPYFFLGAAALVGFGAAAGFLGAGLASFFTW